MYIFDGLLLIITKKRYFKAKILQNLLRNKNCLLVKPQMARNINLIKTGQIGKIQGFSAIHRTSNTRRKSNLHPHQSQFTLPTLQRDTLYQGGYIDYMTWCQPYVIHVKRPLRVHTYFSKGNIVRNFWFGYNCQFYTQKTQNWENLVISGLFKGHKFTSYPSHSAIYCVYWSKITNLG